MENLSPMHILLLGVICMVVFGSKRLPEMGASIGKSIREFKRNLRDDAPDEAPPPTGDDGPRKLSQ